MTLFKRRQPPEQRGNLTDSVVKRLVEAAGAEATADAMAASAVESGITLYAQAFQSVEIGNSAAGMNRAMLAMIVRDLFTSGNSVWVIGTDLNHTPVGTYDLVGRVGRWRYVCTVNQPSGADLRVTVDADQVLHFRRGETTAAPWQGRGPMTIASTTARMLGETERVLGDEMSAQVGRLLPIPNDPEEESDLRADLKVMKGRTLLVESQLRDWDRSGGATPRAEYRTARVGPEPPREVSNLWVNASKGVIAAMGVPVGLVHGAAGSGYRELWRMFLHGSVQPLATVIEDECEAKLNARPDLSFSRLFASDLQGRARALASMVTAGVPIDQARRLAGLV